MPLRINIKVPRGEGYTMKKIITLIAITLALTGTTASALTMTPDGGYVSGSTFTMTPDGSYVGGTGFEMTPNGSYVGTN